MTKIISGHIYLLKNNKTNPIEVCSSCGGIGHGDKIYDIELYLIKNKGVFTMYDMEVKIIYEGHLDERYIRRLKLLTDENTINKIKSKLLLESL